MWCYVALYATVGGKVAPRESAKSSEKVKTSEGYSFAIGFHPYLPAFYGRLLISLRLR